MDYLHQIHKSTSFIRQHTAHKPDIGLILGSGLGPLADEIRAADRIPYDEIPHFPVSTVAGHAGMLVLGTLEGKNVMAMQGRFHFYEGYSMQDVSFPVRVMKALGVKILIVTNACGGMNPAYEPGDLMIIRDHINFMGTNPLIGDNYDELGPRFPDMSAAYDPELRKLAHSVADELNIPVRSGIYTAVSGPYYFSRAELRMVESFGSDAIGMSTVPEVIAAVHAGIRSIGISCITDKADPDQLEPLDHSTVVDVAKRTQPEFTRLIRGILKALPSN
jgi:purine-nucleoside phosphorylase